MFTALHTRENHPAAACVTLRLLIVCVLCLALCGCPQQQDLTGKAPQKKTARARRADPRGMLLWPTEPARKEPTGQNLGQKLSENGPQPRKGTN
ncbi:hypothetical protein DESUT3_13450 [Desulfuromonas versatilis]|uniref:Lipoprotein n=1 Tax=Desulfuromonas versatilis TaxID=2802975 RepID=A0ABN6DVY9_9BACT|nr:hypothetical protein [Desulfuromonas versatilis]BCR04276.1 hypothetical protein DESUT3_13450 [Desulfuromonas versatilis]